MMKISSGDRSCSTAPFVDLRDWMAENDLPALNHQQLNQIEKYSQLMLQWSSKIQLTATRDLAEFIERHVLDALFIVPLLAGYDRVVDVGSGGGLPGLVLAIACPERAFTLLEPIKKKHAFLAHARRSLRLSNVASSPERDDEHRCKELFRPYDCAISRAVWDVPTWLDRGSKMVRARGAVIAMEGQVHHEISDAEIFPYQLPGGRSRCLLRRIVA